MKTNYYKLYQEQLNQLTKEKPSLLLHVCCGPCSSHVVTELSKLFNITIYYSNSNIYPEEEYQRRYHELLHFIDIFNKETNQNIQVIEDQYSQQEWFSNMYPLKDLPEKSMRCRMCYALRMRRAFDYASINHFDYWTTVLSISPHKNSQWINEIGDSYSKEKTSFLYSDFKKNDGYLKSTQLTQKYEMYRQNYCGCMFSYEEMLKKEN